MRYAIAHVSVEDVSRPRVSWVVQARGWAGDAEEPPRFLPLPQRALLYTHKYIAIVSTTVSNDKVEYVDVSGEGDALLGAALCGGVALLFSRKHGVLALSQPHAAHATPSMCESTMGSPCPSDMYDGNLSLYEIDPHEVSLVTQDACGKLKTAFLFHVRRDVAACRAALAELFPAGEERDVDAPLDRAVRRIAADLLDDVPAGDPRWRLRGAATNICLGSSAALQLAAQLRDKQRAFTLFCDFLRAVGLWQRLGLVTRESGGGVVSTESALGGLAEQLATAITPLATAITLRKLQQGPDAQLIDAAIYQVVCGSRAEVEEEPEVEEALSSGALSPADVCYRRVSRACRVLRALCAAAAPPAARAAAAHAAATARAAHECPEPALRAQVHEAAADLADLILTDAEPLSASSHTQHLYEKIRRDTIQPYRGPEKGVVCPSPAPVAEGQTERAAALAEKFKDFELLIEMCVESDDMDKLFAYIDKYSSELATQRLARAADALLVLANEEADSVNRLTTTASLAKLCLYAEGCGGPASGAWARLESRLALAEQHRALPRDLRLHHGLDAGDTAVLPPEHIVQMYIESESSGLTEYDYKKALDLTDYVHDMERRDDLRLRVWCACIRRDDWSSCRVDSPADELQRKMFFRLIDLVHVMGGDLELLLPPVEDILTAPELAELVSDPRFHFIIKYGYECVDTTRSPDMLDE
uniref:Nucleoporin Nup133/Nup155-like C-terminal domain-containing protein n=1 Tax=Heliothis virescens TaxID=7102 RepID=A0A2A4K307_HELVI